MIGADVVGPGVAGEWGNFEEVYLDEDDHFQRPFAAEENDKHVRHNNR